MLKSMSRFYGIITIVILLPSSLSQKLVLDKGGFSGKDVTPIVFGSEESKEVFPVAYADFNSDKITDILSLSRDQSTLSIWFGQETLSPLFKQSIQCSLQENWEGVGYAGRNAPMKIVGVVTADFNGDSILDVMITYKRNPEKVLHNDGNACVNVTSSVEAVIFRGNLTTLECNLPVLPDHVIDNLVDEPLALDINGDMVMDLFGEVYVPGNVDAEKNCSRVKIEKKIWLFKSTSAGDFTSTPILPPTPINFTLADHSFPDPHDTVNCTRPHVNSFGDIDDDGVPELILITGKLQESHDHNNSWKYQRKIYQIKLDDPTVPKFRLMLPPVDITSPSLVDPQVIGQPILMDLNQEAKLLQLFPFCSGKHCGKGANGILVVTENRTEVLPIDFGDATGKWHYDFNKHEKQYPNGSPHSNYSQALTLRAGDFNLDGFPDLIGILRPSGREKEREIINSRAVLFENVPCTSSDKSTCPFPRTFKINFDALNQYHNVTLATFFDLHEDGLVDIIIVRKTDDKSERYKDTYSVYAFQNSPDYDANFMKVMVLSGLPCLLCPQTQTPYGNLLSGPVIKYMTTTQADRYQTAVAAQFYRSSHFALDLPYTIFGVGQSPNFIETLEISVSTNRSLRTQQWQQLIPNSQIIVIPAPLDQPFFWSAKLFLTPSRAVLNTGLVLIGFCTVICLIIGGLQYKERRDDMKERLQEAFHMM